jgi:hypothetical protein
MLKVTSKVDPTISIKHMADGDIGLVVKWDDNEDMIDKLVQRYDKGMVVLGEPSDESYPTIFTSTKIDKYKVMILNPGTELVIE